MANNGTVLGPFWDNFGTIMGSFGTILGPFWDHFRTIFGPFWGPLWGPFWDNFGTIIIILTYFDIWGLILTLN